MIRVIDEKSGGPDDGRQRLMRSTNIAMSLLAEGKTELARQIVLNYVCKEYFRQGSQKQGGGYKASAGDKVVVSEELCIETGRRNLMALMMLMS